MPRKPPCCRAIQLRTTGPRRGFVRVQLALLCFDRGARRLGRSQFRKLLLAAFCKPRLECGPVRAARRIAGSLQRFCCSHVLAQLLFKLRARRRLVGLEVAFRRCDVAFRRIFRTQACEFASAALSEPPLEGAFLRVARPALISVPGGRRRREPAVQRIDRGS